MAIKQVGRTTYFQGKRLFDILSRLKNFGIGRMVYRNHFAEQYPESSYYIITRVYPDMSDPTQGEYREVPVSSYAYGLHVFRGVQQSDECLIRTCYKPDWKLVARTDEDNFKNFRVDKKPLDFPTAVPFPPLLNYMMRTKRKAMNQASEEDLKMPLVFNRSWAEKHMLSVPTSNSDLKTLFKDVV